MWIYCFVVLTSFLSVSQSLTCHKCEALRGGECTEGTCDGQWCTALILENKAAGTQQFKKDCAPNNPTGAKEDGCIEDPTPPEGTKSYRCACSNGDFCNSETNVARMRDMLNNRFILGGGAVGGAGAAGTGAFPGGQNTQPGGNGQQPSPSFTPNQPPLISPNGPNSNGSFIDHGPITGQGPQQQPNQFVNPGGPNGGQSSGNPQLGSNPQFPSPNGNNPQFPPQNIGNSAFPQGGPNSQFPVQAGNNPFPPQPGTTAQGGSQNTQGQPGNPQGGSFNPQSVGGNPQTPQAGGNQPFPGGSNNGHGVGAGQPSNGNANFGNAIDPGTVAGGNNSARDNGRNPPITNDVRSSAGGSPQNSQGSSSGMVTCSCNEPSCTGTCKGALCYTVTFPANSVHNQAFAGKQGDAEQMGCTDDTSALVGGGNSLHRQVKDYKFRVNGQEVVVPVAQAFYCRDKDYCNGAGVISIATSVIVLAATALVLRRY